MEEAKEKITNLTEDREFIGLYDEELEKEREYKDRMAYAEKVGLEEGMKKGLEQGIEQGIEQGALEAKLETARKMFQKGIDEALIYEITGFSVNEINQ